MRFVDRLSKAIASADSFLCVGLDPDLERMPAGIPRTPEGVLEFNIRIIDATKEFAAAFKPNAAFYEAMGHQGVWVLEETRKAIPSDRIALLDAKRGDIGNSSTKYAEAVFDTMGFDAVTVSPYLGRESLLPFLERPDRGAFVLSRTSNPTAGEVQKAHTGGVALYVAIARMVAEMDGDNGGLVVGATVPGAFEAVREVAPGIPLLIPGVGAQGGELAPAVRAAEHGPVLINSSRGIIYASSGSDYAEAARSASEKLTSDIRSTRGG